MATPNTIKDEAIEALGRMQKFDVSVLPRERELGSDMNFHAAVEPAQRLVDLYKRLSITALEDISGGGLGQIRERANADYSVLKQILDFKLATQSNPDGTRQSFIQQVIASYDPTFQALHPYIAYSLHRSADFQRLDAESRATMQVIADRAGELEGKLVGHENEAKRVLGEIRRVAAEQGVSQQAIHFGNEATRHDVAAEVWRVTMRNYAIAIGVYAVGSIFVHKIPFLNPTSYYESIQLGVSKVLVFTVLAYMLLISSRNFMGHKHNAIVNRHRQNALMTHKALIEAVEDSGVREAIMVQAASSIFAPQSTGYAGDYGKGESNGTRSVVELLSKAEKD